MTGRIEKINKAVSGWCNYFRCAWIAKRYLQ
ncbi:group II intron maturase-specific domain-containing protein [uncultured Faecalibaculum sp.]